MTDGVLVRVLEGEAVLLNLKSSSYFGLDDVGTRIWEVLVAGPSIQAAYETLLAEFEVEPEQLRADLHVFIGKLVNEGLVEVRNGQD